MPDAACDLLLVDGKHLFWRAASAAMLSVDGSPTGGVYAFIRALTRVHEQFGGYIVVCWEGSPRAKLVRTQMLPDYKYKGRVDPAREDAIKMMLEQTDKLAELLTTLGIAQARARGWEADDAMATLARRAELQGSRVGIYSGDSDMCQCVSDRVFLIRPVSKDIEVVDVEGVNKWLGVRPGGVPLMKALAGDSSDNIPGVKWIGKVAAARLVNELRSIYRVMEEVQRDRKPSIPRFGDKAWDELKQAVADGQLLLSWKLARVNRNASVRIQWSELDKSALVRELVELQFRSLLGNRELYRLHRLTATG